MNSIRNITLLFIIIAIFFILILIDNSKTSTPEYQLNIKSQLYLDKSIYYLNDTIEFSLEYKIINHEEDTKIKFCSSANKISISFVKEIPHNYKKIFPKKYWINKLDLNKSVEKFYLDCPKDLLKNNGLLNFKKNKIYIYKIKFSFLKENNKYFLVNKNGKKIKIDREGYYSINLFFKEGFFSSDDYANMLDRYVFLKVLDDKLYIYSQL